MRLALPCVLLLAVPGFIVQISQAARNGNNKAVVCENKQRVISCKAGKVLDIKSANYGRLNKNTCPHRSIRTTSCRAPVSLKKVRQRCNGRKSCKLVANNNVFGDPCPGTYKYLKVTYRCKKRKPTGNENGKAVVCENKQRVISCKAGKVLDIKSANYGRLNKNTCPHRSIRTTSCRAPVSLKKVRQKCNGRKSCKLVANNNVFGDPCPGTYKYLKVTYRCKKRKPTGNENGKAVVCENKQRVISCKAGKVLDIKSANYGRLNKNTCPHRSIRTTSCRAPVSLKKMRQRCNGRKSCKLVANNNVFGDPCPGTYKYLKVTYRCKKRKPKGNENGKAVVCENKQRVISCKAGKVLDIKSANYGRLNKNTCPHRSIRTTSCRAPVSLKKVRQRCNGRKSCKLVANNNVFGDPCPGTYKYLKVTYRCKKRKPTGNENGKAVVCENKQRVISCKAGKVLDIKSANYGRLNKNTCPHRSIRTTSCRAPLSLKKVRQRCNGRKSCKLVANNNVFGDPCPGTYKYLKVTYRCKKRKPAGNENGKAVVCENKQRVISCKAGKVLDIKSANYGRLNKNTCPHRSIRTTSCRAPVSLKKVRQRCNGRKSCKLVANNNVFGDPCPGTYKYLKVTYRCKKRKPKGNENGKAVVCENKQRVISCKAGKVLDIKSANYGRLNKNTCPHRSIRTTSCRAPVSLKKVRQRCNGRKSCKLVANNNVFGDPCPGTYKYLKVTYRCKKRKPKGNENGKAVVCENKQRVISCKAGKVLDIKSANYGRLNKNTCPHRSIRTTSCRAPVSLKKVRQRCNGRKSCKLVANNNVFGDPCPGTYKYLKVTYRCKKRKPTGNENGKAVVCENKQRVISCKAGKVLDIKSANYGRLNKNTCSHRSIRTTSCRAPVSLRKVRQRCNGRKSCKLVANNNVFGDPCRGTYKYLKVTYRCKQRKRTFLCGGKKCHRNAVCSRGRCVCRRHFVGDGSKSCARTCTCSASGDPHYKTHDGVMIHFQGKCRYTLTKSINERDPCTFNIEVQNEPRSNGKVSVTRTVYLMIYGKTIKMGRDKKIYMNGRVINLPYLNKRLKIFMSSNVVRIQTKCGVLVTWNWRSTVVVDVPKRFANKLSGICGNCNGNRRDDYRTKDGRDVFNNKNRFALIGQSYAVYNDDENRRSKCNTGVVDDPCTNKLRHKAKQVSVCGYLHPDNRNKNPFGVCVNDDRKRALEFYESCVFDYCANSGNPRNLKTAVCDALDGFVEECNNNGYTFKWRSKHFCPIVCSKNMIYSPRVCGCPATCADPKSPARCSLPPTEGCQCKPGYLLSGTKCVKPRDCGCRSKDGEYWPLGAIKRSSDCRTIKKCMLKRGMPIIVTMKRNNRCHRYGVCRLVNGNYGCKCRSGFRGDGIRKCDVSRKECDRRKRCGQNARCVKGKCRCSNRCKGNAKKGCRCPCTREGKYCAPGAFCTTSKKCKCLRGYTGSGYKKCRKVILECLKTNRGEAYDGFISNTKSGKTCQKWGSQTPHSHGNEHLESSENYCRNPDRSRKPWCYTGDPETRWEYCDIPMCKQKKKQCNHQRKVKCESWKFKRATCEVSDIEGISFIKVLKQYSKSPCVFGESFSRHGDMIVVQKGCRALFKICFIPEKKEPELPPEGECRTTLSGSDYDGTWDRTESGLRCQNWNNQSPHKHNNDMKAGDKNFCRNPDASARPWCFTTDPLTRWEYCNIPLCDKPKNPNVDECLKTSKGEGYRGYQAMTEKGLTCQRWDVNYPHDHHFSRLASDSNYCRNPDYSARPWCFTNNPEIRWQYCSIPACSECVVTERVKKCKVTYKLSGKCFYKSNMQNKCKYTVQLTEAGGKTHSVIKFKNSQKTLNNNDRIINCATFRMQKDTLIIKDKICSKDCPDEE